MRRRGGALGTEEDAMAGDGRRRTPVSIVCVFNDLEVRTTCLDRSIAAGLRSAPATEYLPVDNRDGRFRSAGAALNHGARLARHDVVVFVHQDVYLHSLAALEQAAAALQDDPGTGLVGAVGITATGSVAGIVRDRVVRIGEPSTPTASIDSVDEVLFLIERSQVLAEPLSEHPELAWHAYAVEYGARVRDQGRRVVTHDLPLTHNSMTTNLDLLAEAHHHVADLYPALLPVQTTCGVVRAPHDRSRWRTVARRRRGAMTWLRESFTAVRLARRDDLRVHDVVLGDIRLTIDDVLDRVDATGLDVVNLDLPATAAEPEAWDVTSLTRRGRDVSATAATVADLAGAFRRREHGRALLVTGVDEAAIAALAPAMRGAPHLVGVARDTGAWILCCPTPPDVRATWPARRNAPFGLRPRTAAGPSAPARSPGLAPSHRAQ
ncbi:glycosyltransferase [Cellulomonas sp. P22]|uniref:glycosyltransferase n=1 Tax=Cellulomonas sp. P22 TaxID=3373189 RepID=UPI0037AF2425